MTMKAVPDCGVEAIDEGHRSLGRHIEELIFHWKIGSGDRVLEACVHGFIATAKAHFHTEIKVLEDLGADTSDHRAAHFKLLHDIEGLLSETLGSMRPNRWFALVDTIERLLYEHEIVDDASYFGLLMARPASPSA